jgi:hypothetical protein
MRVAWLVPAAVVLLAGCTPDDPVFRGYPMADYFPADGQVLGWTFGNRDVEVDYVLDRTFDPEASVTANDVTLHTFSTSRRCIAGVEECGAGFVWSYTFASRSGVGVFLHGYEVAGEGAVTLDPPVKIANGHMAPLESVETAGSDGHDWTASFEELTDCYQTFEVAWQCARIHIETDPPGHWLTGDWYAVPGYNVVAFQRAGDEGLWRLIEPPERP